MFYVLSFYLFIFLSFYPFFSFYFVLSIPMLLGIMTSTLQLKLLLYLVEHPSIFS